MKLTCDSCGSVQRESNAVCELCGDSLHEEAERKQNGTAGGLLLGAVGATVVLVIVPAVFVKNLWFPEVSTPMFTSVYLLIWVIGSFVGRKYQPKDSYDFGYRRRYGFIDNPFSLRDDYDRHHAAVGLVLLPMNIVSGLWVAFYFRLTAK